MVSLAADAALGQSHLRPLRHGRATRAPRLDVSALRPDERNEREHEDDDRDPEVEPMAEVVMRGIDAERLYVRTKARVPGDVEGEEAGGPDAEAPVDEKEHAHPEETRGTRRETAGGTCPG